MQRILLIEDDRQIRRFLRLALEAEGFEVDEAGRGGEGLAMAADHAPDLFLVDLGLPDMEGVDVIRQLRTWTMAPVIVLSARTEEMQKVAALDGGADDYLTKPFGNHELMARVRVHLRRAAQPNAPGQRMRFGDVEVDIEKRAVTRSGEAVHLTPIEFKLLACLLVNPGKVMTHTQLLKEVWGGGHAERGHYLRVYMGHLRQKLERDPAQPQHIVTETGVGYRLKV